MREAFDAPVLRVAAATTILSAVPRRVVPSATCVADPSTTRNRTRARARTITLACAALVTK